MRMQAHVTPGVRRWTPAQEDEDRVELADAMEAVLEAHQHLLAARNEPTPMRAMFLIAATRGTHRTMMLLLATLEIEGRLTDKPLGRARAWLDLHAEALRLDGDHRGTVDRCGRYLAAAQGELQRLGSAVVKSTWRPSRSQPGYYRL